MNNLLERFNDKMTYTGKNVKTILSDLEEFSSMNVPSKVRRGDVFLSYGGKKKRPCVVIKVLKNDTVMYLGLTSSDNVNCLSEFKSRFFKDGWISNGFSVTSVDYVKENFIGFLDSPRELKIAVDKFKKLIIENL